MTVHSPLEVSDSCVRRIYAALCEESPLTQRQLRTRTGFTLAPVCKCLHYLIDEGYVREAGRTFNRLGTSVGRPQIRYARTAKDLPPANVPDMSNVPSMDDLAAVMADIVRLRLI